MNVILTIAPAISILFIFKNVKNYVAYMDSNEMTTCSILVILQRKSAQDETKLFYQLDIHFCCEHFVLFIRNLFKFFGHTQFLEVCPASQEIMLFYDDGFVVLRFACGFNKSSIRGCYCDVKVD